MYPSILYHTDLTLAIEELGAQQRTYDDLDFDEKFHISTLLLEDDHHLAYEDNTIYNPTFFSTLMDILKHGDDKDHEKFYDLQKEARKGIVEHCATYLTKIIDDMCESFAGSDAYSENGIKYLRDAAEGYYSLIGGNHA